MTLDDWSINRLDTAAITGIFTIAGVVVTASAALFAAWIKYRTDRRQELQRERKELYARFQHATAQMWDSLFVVVKEGEQGARPSGSAVTNLDQSWIAWAKIWMEMSIIASDTIWPTVEPLFDEFRTAYFERRFPSEGYEEKLRELMRRELGR